MTGSQEQIKHVVDAASASIVVGSLMQWLPPLAALFTIIWTIIRICETKTVRRFRRRIRYGRRKK
jgi:hypothetical protein